AQVLGPIRTESPDPPAPLTTAGLQNVIAFGRLAGYVRYFHPSDQAAQLDWETFLINGVRQMESAGSPDELAQRLRTLFAPIAPTVQVFPIWENPGPVAELQKPAGDGWQVVNWQHYGLGIGTTNPEYRSDRVATPLVSGSLPQGYVDPAA